MSRGHGTYESKYDDEAAKPDEGLDQRPRCVACDCVPRNLHADTPEVGLLCMGCLGEFQAFWAYGDEAEVTKDWRELMRRKHSRG